MQNILFIIMEMNIFLTSDNEGWLSHVLYFEKFWCTVKILKLQTPEKFAVITLKFEQGGCSIE